MRKFELINKKVSETPLDAIYRFKKDNPEYELEKISYAGRLDPMANGLLLLLIGDENKRRKDYEKLNKVYESEMIIGISTDSYDALGLIESVCSPNLDKNQIVNSIKNYKGKYNQEYPPYSSKSVQGKPLFYWAKNKLLSNIIIPKKQVEIYKIEILNFEKIKSEDLVRNIVEKIKLVKGDFRQIEIINGWKRFRDEYKDVDFIKVNIVIECSSGTYVRAIVNDIGKKLRVGAFALSITRTKIGEYNI